MDEYIRRGEAIEQFEDSTSAIPEKLARIRIKEIPAADVVEVVRCGDCKNYRPWGKVYERNDYTGLCIVWNNMSVHKEDYCSHAVRKSKEGGKKNGK